VRRIDKGHCGPKACSSPSYTNSVASLPACCSESYVALVHRIGQLSSEVPWWISSGSLMRSK